ncbi:hypothetical protein HF847_00890 [Clostridium cochlearium]|uniref:Phage replication initiation protein n=1 Tax=Clostridium cochlearium TaxID=1494 RepID=A0A2X2WCU8_CLOCO|nr:MULTISPECIES: helix-turn-helix domain-containing protein [Clostridium]MBE6057651.1 hypothetical protein [Clostridium sp.]MDU1442077.1 helix-turn-helix domain-containing protein [Clostridium cochlearium]NME94566.1 hypothetical protein [Clostridium cochlearium]SQB35483.1 phage replication initiation protein [Clostridium cochlearium]
MGYTVIDNEVLENKDLNIQEQSLLIALISYYNKEKGYAYPSYKQLMNRSKIKSRTTFINTLNSLLTKKYIKRETIKGKGCKYFIKDFLPSTDIDQVQKCTRYKNVPTPSTDIDQQQVQKCTTTNTNTITNIITKYYIDLKFIDDVIDKVKITQEQYDKLIKKFNIDIVHKNIINLDNYIANGKGKNYKDHYRVINAWCNKAKSKDKTKSNLEDWRL